jgi:hypothetical protein
MGHASLYYRCGSFRWLAGRGGYALLVRLRAVACLNEYHRIRSSLMETREISPEADRLAITQTALDYIEGWYTGDAERMERSLHPDLAKRIVVHDPRGFDRLEPISALGLVIATRKGVGCQTPPEAQRNAVTILDVFGNAACVRVDAAGWIDYLHLGRLNGRWQIVNVLWEKRQPGVLPRHPP